MCVANAASQHYILTRGRKRSPAKVRRRMNRSEHADRPQGLMADLENASRSVRRLPNTRALDVLNQMYAYHDIQAHAGQIESAYDHAA